MEPVTAHWRSLAIACVAIFGAMVWVMLPVNVIVDTDAAAVTIGMTGLGALLGAALVVQLCPGLARSEVVASAILGGFVMLGVDRDDGWSTVGIALAVAGAAAGLGASARGSATALRGAWVAVVFAAAVDAATLVILVAGGRTLGLGAGVVVIGSAAIAGALTVVLAPEIRAGQVWIGQMLLAGNLGVSVLAGGGKATGDVVAGFVGFAIIALLGLAAAALVRGLLPERPLHADLPTARAVAGGSELT